MGEGERGKTDRLRLQARQAPLESGVYLMKDADGRIIYVGKAKALRNRLSSYFSGTKELKTRHLVSRIDQIEYIVTKDEYEALLLENTLIKQHSPRYNINLKDGKTYPVIKVTNEEFPRVYRTRRVVDDGARYYGPFPSAQTVDGYLKLIDDLFPLRRCKRMRARSSPCMYYHIGKCPGPCAGKIDKRGYARIVKGITDLLEGKIDALLADIDRRMAKEAAELRFEKAAALRDARAALLTFQPENQVVDFDPEDRDYLAWAEDGHLVSVAVFQMRGGKLSGRDLFRTRSAAEEAETIQDFLSSYYGPGRLPPPKVFLARPVDLGMVAAYVERELGVSSSFLSPDEKRHQAVCAMAAQNAREDIARRLREGGDPEGVETLKRELGLPVLPEHIEGFDIAQLSGRYPVASLIVFRNGIPDKKGYRHFRLKSLDGAIDDFESMREAVSRRYSRAANEGAELPDLIMVDGGLGQVNAAKSVLDLLELDIPVVGLAKREEEIYFPGKHEPLALSRHSPGLRLLQRVRDETHRFATGLNQRLRSKALKLVRLESLDGVGPARARNLIMAFGSLEALAEQKAESVAERARLPLEVARRVIDRLNSPDPAGGAGGEGDAGI